MSHPILALQAMLVGALDADEPLVELLGGGRVFDAPPRDVRPPYVTIARHDVLPRDGDLAPGHDHRLVLHVWAAEASRKAVLVVADRVLSVALTAAFDGELRVTHRQHDRTDTAIDRETGFARAAVALRMFTEAAG
jgi:hypothetical protein